MTGFSAEWLALREPADHAARNSDILSRVATLFAGRESISVIDLGSGSGSNLRGLAPQLPGHQNWTLVDYDPALLAAAQDALAAVSREVSYRGDDLSLELCDRLIDVTFREADLSRGTGSILDPSAHLVTAAAFFDLVSPEWIARFVTDLAARGLPLYTVLIYNGAESWEPPHPADEAVNAAFNLHQTTDKGFGPAAGPSAAGLLADALQANGYEVLLGDSPWRLGPDDRSLIDPLAEGIAAAVAETGRVPAPMLRSWLGARRRATAGVIGHTDLLAIPPH